MIEITSEPISPDQVVNRVKTADSGCVVTYVGLIRNHSRGKRVLSVEYQDPDNQAQERLQEIANQAKQRWPVNNIAIVHRIGRLVVGDINLVVAVAAAHRREGYATSRFIINQFKQRLPTTKKETYLE